MEEVHRCPGSSSIAKGSANFRDLAPDQAASSCIPSLRIPVDHLAPPLPDYPSTLEMHASIDRHLQCHSHNRLLVPLPALVAQHPFLFVCVSSSTV